MGLPFTDQWLCFLRLVLRHVLICGGSSYGVKSLLLAVLGSRLASPLRERSGLGCSRN